jgi:hypothetical protein
MTPDDKNEVFWTVVVAVIFAIIGSGIAYGIFCALKKRRVFLASASGLKAAGYSRDLQPFKYWSVMMVYTSLFIGTLFIIYSCLREAFDLLRK